MLNLRTEQYAPAYTGAYCPDCHGPIMHATFTFIPATGYFCCAWDCGYRAWDDDPSFETNPPIWLNIG